MPVDLLENIKSTDTLMEREPIDLLALPPEKKSFISQNPHSFADDLRDFFGKESEAEKAKAANSLTYAEMLNISPSTAYEYHDEISSQVREKLASEKIFTEKKGMGKAVSHAIDNSIGGMMGKEKVPEGFESVDQFERWTNGLLTMSLDLPVFLSFMALGGGPTTPSGWAGGFGGVAGVRQVLVDRYSKGEAKSFGEFSERTGRAVKETIKGQVVGGLTGVAGGASPIGYKALSELATMTVAGKLVEGQIPTAREFVDNAAILLVMHAGITGLGNISSVKAQLQRSFVEDGITPKMIVDNILSKPIEGDVTEAIDKTIAEIKQSMPKSLAPESFQKTPSPVPSAGTSETPGQILESPKSLGEAKEPFRMTKDEAVTADVYRGGKIRDDNLNMNTDGGYYGEGISFSDSIDTAKVYSDKAKQPLIKATIKLEKPFIIDWSSQESGSRTRILAKEEGIELSGSGMVVNPVKFTDTLKGKGYDGVIVKKANEPNEYVVFSKKGIVESSPVAPTRDISAQEGLGQAESSDTSIKNAVVDAERLARGESPIETPAIKRASTEEVKARVDSGELDPRNMARKINNLVEAGEPIPALTEEWSDAFAYDKKRLQNESKAVEKEIDEYSDEGRSMTELEQRQLEIETLISENENATKAIGTAWSDIGRSRQLQISEDYSFSAMVQRAKKDGIELTPEVRKRLKGLSNKIEKAQQDLDGFSEKTATENLDKSIKILKNEEGLKQRKEKRSIKKEEIDAEFDDIVKKLNKQISGQFNVGLDPMAVKYMVDLARNRIKKGIVTAEGIIDEIYIGLKNAGIEYSKRDIRDAISGYGITKSMSKDEIKTALREAKSQMRLISALEDAKKGEAPLRSGLQRDKPSDRVRELQKEVTQAMREAGIQKGKTPEKQWKTSLDAVKTRLSNHIVDLARRLETGIKEPKKPGIVYDERANELKALRDKVQKVLDFVEETKGKKELSPEQKIKMAMASAEKSLAEYERRINEGDLAAKKKPSNTPITPELEALRKDRDLLKEVYNMMKDEAKPKKTPDEIAEKSFKTRTENQIAEYERRLTEKDFEPTPKKEPRKFSDEENKLKFKIDSIKHEYAKQHEQYLLDKRGTGEIIKDSIVQSAGLVKAIKSAYDVSAPGRQGFFALVSHPILGFKNVKEMFRALGNEEAAFRIETELKNKENYTNGNYKKAGVTLYERGGGKATNEMFKSRWGQHIPGIQASERAFVSFLNLMRTDLFDAMLKNNFGKQKPTLNELKALGSYANEATGHGTLKGYESSIQGLGTFMWAPGLALSRFQMILGHGLMPGGGRTAKTRIAVAKEYGRILGGLALIYSVNAILNDKPTEDDPVSSDYGKLIIGNTRIDVLAGVSQATVLMSRVITGETKNRKTGQITPIRGDYVPYGGTNVGDVLWRFLRSKLTPVLGIAVNQFAGEDMVGAKTTLYDIPEEAIVPLSFMDIWEAMQEEGVPAGIALGVLGMFGVGIQTHEQKGAKR